MPDGDLYEDLGVDPDASAEEIKRAHRDAVKRVHPDNAETGDREVFEKTQRAYIVLSDPEKRAKYDKGEKVSNDPENREHDLAAIIISAFRKVLGSADVMHDDLIALTKEKIAATTKEIRTGIGHVNVEIETMSIVLERLSSKGEHNVIAFELEDLIKAQRAQVEQLEKAVAIHIEAHERCAEFAYRTDPRDMGYAAWDFGREPSFTDAMRYLEAGMAKSPFKP